MQPASKKTVLIVHAQPERTSVTRHLAEIAIKVLKAQGQGCPNQRFGPPPGSSHSLDYMIRCSYIPTVAAQEETMRFIRSITMRMLAPLVGGCLAFGARASTQACVPPTGFVDIPHPQISAGEKLVSRTEEVTIERPLAIVLGVVNKPLKDTISSAASLPGVSGDHMLTEGEFGLPGSRRLTCLSDGSTLEEEVLERTQASDSFHFRYIVWNYTSDKARPVDFAVGEFRYTELNGTQTHIAWTYSFRLKTERFPGELGPLGRFLFQIVFLNRDYAAMMRGVLAGYQADAQRLPRTD
jgi:hypothetical protein